MPGGVSVLKALVLVVVIVLASVVLPVVPYLTSLPIPGAYRQGIDECLADVSQDNATLAEIQRQACYDQFASPPVDLYGFATPAYALFGYGAAPYPPAELVSQGNHSVVAYFSGGRVTAVEEAGGPGVVLNPKGIVYFQSAVVTSFDFGVLNISIRVKNIGNSNVTDTRVYVSMSGFSQNSTIGGLTLIQPKYLGGCPGILSTYSYCAVSQLATNNLPVNRSFTFYAEVRGTVNGKNFLYRQGISEDYPQGGIGPLWVGSFIGQVNRDRGGPTLVENSTLDAFAAVRFKNASMNYQISDYGLDSDVKAYLGQSFLPNEVGEELLFPGVFSPTSYPSFLRLYAEGHWSGLDNPLYRQFGYYVGYGPYYQVSIPCSVYEIPQPGLNITQYFADHGCTTTVVPEIWLVIILTP